MAVQCVAVLLHEAHDVVNVDDLRTLFSLVDSRSIQLSLVDQKFPYQALTVALDIHTVHTEGLSTVCQICQAPRARA